MTLRKRVLINIAATVTGLMLILWGISHFVLMDSFLDLEEQNVRRDVQRAQDAISEEISNLSATTLDWSSWDDTYAFIEDRNDGFLTANLVDATFDSTKLRLNVMLFVDATGNLVYGKAFDFHNMKEMPLPQDLFAHLSGQGLMNHPDVKSRVNGIVMLGDGPMLVASTPIQTSEEKGPIRGALIMGRYLDRSEINRLADITHMSLSVHPAGSADLPSDVQAANSRLTEDVKIVVDPLNEKSIAGYAALKDIYGKPLLTLRVDTPRDIYAQGATTVSYFVLFMLGAGLVCGGAVYLCMEKTVLKRVASLARAVTRIGEGQDLSKRVEMNGRDELSRLGEKINGMLAELEDTEHKMVQLERMRALGEMAAGISHNLNNILTGIWGPVQLMQKETDDPKILDRTDMIAKSAERASELVNRINRAVQGSKEDSGQPVDVNAVVREAIQNARPRWKDEGESSGVSIDVVTDLKGVPFIMGTRAEFHDVIINMLFNSIDAMPNGGEIRIASSVLNGEVKVDLSDTGIGMDEETLKRVFEPFFTTKRDVGTGLGMSTIHSTVVRWGGTIDIQSAVGKGTAVSVRLPSCIDVEVPELEIGKVPEAPRSRLLVVEDDEDICHFFAHFLEGQHDVETVSDGREALDAFTPGRYDVALIDLGLPGMPGDQLALEIRERDAALVTVLVTGWDLEKDDPRLSAFDFWLKKPLKNLNHVKGVIGSAIAFHQTKANASS